LTNDHYNYVTPDYSDDDLWIALPWKEDVADKTPVADLVDGQSEATADVFYIHPTTMRNNLRWNAKMDKTWPWSFVEKSSVQHQSSVFNGSCRVFAPRYRDATLNAYFTQHPSSNSAFKMAYSDVKAAFEHYLNNHNEGRPIVLAGHSQGGSHMISLLMEYENHPVIKEQLVVAYIIGMPVFEDYFRTIEPCESPTDTYCYCSWSTYAYLLEPPDFYKNAIVTNPLNWTIDGSYASKDANEGAVGVRYNKLYPEFTDARSNDGVLWVRKPDHWMSKVLPIKNYHIADFNLFWMNIRNNVKDRIVSHATTKATAISD